MKKLYLWKGGCKNGYYTEIFTTVDDEDYEYLNKWRWRLVKEAVTRDLFYAKRTAHTRNGKSVNYSIHRVLLRLTDPSQKGDHIDGDGINNQKYNLRISTNSQNISNSFKRQCKTYSTYKGVSFNNRNRNWVAYIFVNSKKLHLGCHTHEKEAARAYNEAALKYKGAFARLNVLD